MCLLLWSESKVPRTLRKWMFCEQRMQVSSIASLVCMSGKYDIYIFWWMHENSNSQWDVCVKFYINKKIAFLLSCNFSLYLFHCFRYFHNFFFRNENVYHRIYETWAMIGLFGVEAGLHVCHLCINILKKEILTYCNLLNICYGSWYDC